MGLSLDIEIDTNGIETRLQKAVEDGVRNAAKEFEDELQDKAEQKIIRENAVWRKELLASFESDIIKRPDGLWVRLSNVADHAAPVEEGAEYTERGPPVFALLPWVKDNLKGFRINSGGDLAHSKNLAVGAMHPEFPGYTVSEVDKAFWLQRKIKRDGIAPVGYMLYAATWARTHGHDVTSDSISRSLLKYGLI